VWVVGQHMHSGMARVCHAPASHTRAHPQVSIWDARAGERGGCVHRTGVATAGSPLYALAWCGAQGGLLGAAGAERAVQMVDPRR
jgi:hypothetical protein